jgi:hypothetical protein
MGLEAPVLGDWNLLECWLVYVIQNHASALPNSKVRSKFRVGQEVKKEVLVEEGA